MPNISKQELDKRFLGELSLIEKKMSFDKETSDAINVIKQNIRKKSMSGGGEINDRQKKNNYVATKSICLITAIVTSYFALFAATIASHEANFYLVITVPEWVKCMQGGSRLGFEFGLSSFFIEGPNDNSQKRWICKETERHENF